MITATPDQNTPELVVSHFNFIKELNTRIIEGESLYYGSVHLRFELNEFKEQYANWNNRNIEFLKWSFDNPKNQYILEYSHAGEVRFESVITIEFHDFVLKYKDLLKSKINNLINLFNIAHSFSSQVEDEDTVSVNSTDNLKVFIVHGHDNVVKMEVSGFIENLGAIPIILHEQPNSGKTIIEKIESYTNVGFGIVLYTPCDLGAKKGEEFNLNKRARQNVVFEHGYLIGKIGRNKVAALVKDNVETPTDISGVVYIDMKGNWKLDLAKELKEAGYNIDLNKAV